MKQRRSRRGRGMIGGMLMGLILMCGAARGEEPAGKSEPSTVPSGPPWPECWEIKISLPEAIAVGKPFAMTVKITAKLFDVVDMDAVPMVAGDGLKIVEGAAPWKGNLKKGESKEFQLSIVASKEGINGQGGVAFTLPTFYQRLREYITTQTEGTYARENAKAEILERLAVKEKLAPKYVDVAGAVIRAGKKEEK